MNGMGSPTAHFSREPEQEGAAKRAKTGMKGMFKKNHSRSSERERPAPESEVTEGSEPKADAGIDSEAVARAVLDALNAHEPL